MSNRRRDSRSQRWSACSLRQLRYFLTSGRGSCLANYPAPSAITLPGRRALPGQAISLDTQCFKVASREKSFTTMFRYFLSSPDIFRVQSSHKFSSIFLTSKNVQAIANLHIFCHPGMTRTLLLQDRGTRACFHDARVCTQLFCYSPDYAGCAAYRPAAEGSACGGGGVCREGSCVYTSTPTRVSSTRARVTSLQGLFAVAAVSM